MRKLLLLGSLGGLLAAAAPAWAQKASLLHGSATGQQVQSYSVIDKSPLAAPIPNQAPKPSMLSNIASLLKFPTIGSNPVVAVKTKPPQAGPPPASTFQPQMPFYHK